MIPLPIVVRELRVASRQRATYWMRSAVAGAAFVVWLFLLMTGSRLASQGSMGPLLFKAIGIVALLFCLLAGVFFTSDCLSQERREGTLGLLFLTDLKGYDVVGGKLMATSLPAFYGMLTILPILALPLMMGGVTGGEYWRITLVLLITLLWSLCLGLMVSAFARETRQALSLTVLLILILAGVIPLAGCLPQLLAASRVTETWYLWFSPAYLYGRAFDAYFNWGRQEFWATLGVVSGTAAIALALAALRLPHAWRETGKGPAAAKVSHGLRRWRFGGTAYREARRGLLDQNPFHWLAGRDRRPRWGACLSAAVLLTICSYFCFEWLYTQSSRSFDFDLSMSLLTAFFAHLVLKWQVAVEASRQFNEACRSGSIELLLTTPIKMKQVIDGQRAALWRSFILPLIAALLLNVMLLFLILGSVSARLPDEPASVLTEILLGGSVLMLADFHALGWVGMWMGLRQKQHHRAILATLGRIMVIPWLGLLFCYFLGVSGFIRNQESVMVLLFFWYSGSLGLDLALAGWARTELVHSLRRVSAEPDAPESVRNSPSEG